MTASCGRCSRGRKGRRKFQDGFPEKGGLSRGLRKEYGAREKVCRQREPLVQRFRGETEHESLGSWLGDFLSGPWDERTPAA